MSPVEHAIVWLNHSEAKVYRFGASLDSEVRIHSHSSLQRLHHRSGGWEAGGNPPQDTDFFRQIVGTLDHIAGIVLTGPGNAKSAFKKFLDAHRPELTAQILPGETGDHGNEALVAAGRSYFRIPQA